MLDRPKPLRVGSWGEAVDNWQQAKRMSPPGRRVDEQLADDAEPDFEWLQQHLASAQLLDDDDDDSWADPTGGRLTEALEACENGAADRLSSLLANLTVADLEMAGPDGDTALNLAALYGHLDCVKLLLEKGCQLDAANEEDGSTALHNAAAGGFLEMVQLLLEKSTATAVNALDEDNETPLHTAARGGHVEVVKLLLERGADASIKNASGNTPAEEADEEEVIQLLRQGTAGAAAQ
jgi:ankyrin repeat protein